LPTGFSYLLAQSVIRLDKTQIGTRQIGTATDQLGAWGMNCCAVETWADTWLVSPSGIRQSNGSHRSRNHPEAHRFPPPPPGGTRSVLLLD
jgi:hypothetical protein